MNFSGRWITRNGTLVACHAIKDCYPGDLEKWCGHTIPIDSEAKLVFTWNINGECMRVIGIGDDTKKWDLMVGISGKDDVRREVKVEGCKECEK